jgi:hypothetical protein
MEISKAKLLFDEGVFKTAVISRYPMRKGYMLALNASHNRISYLTGQRTGNEPREFLSIDAAVKNAQKVGFQKITVDLS